MNADPAENEKKKTGRPRSFEDKRFRKAFLTALQAGLSRKEACKCFGVGLKTLGRECQSDPQFGADVRYARKLGKVTALSKIIRSKDWRAAAWYLERVHYEEFAKKQPDVVTKDQLNSTIAAVVALLFSGNVPRSEHEALAKIQGTLTLEPPTLEPPPSPDPAT